MTTTNVLYYGNNLDVLRRHVKDETVDLVYLDPPFNSNANYNVLFAEHGERSAAQIEAFEDTWEWNTESAAAYEETVEAGGEVAKAMLAFRTLLGTSDMMAYLAMMAPRVVELRRVLKPTGSLYLHCDPTASHYLKLLLDAVFGPQHFRSEITWKRTSGHSNARGYGSVHDVLLYFVASDKATWNRTFQPYDAGYVEQYYRYKDADGRSFMSGDLVGHAGVNPVFEWKGISRPWRFPVHRLDELEATGRIFWTRNEFPRLKRYLDDAKGMPVQDVWTDIGALRSWHAERLGYPTQKPLALTNRIIEASSNPGDVVLDPFCGCGTTIDSAEALGRRWVGIDITHLAIGLIKHRLVGRYGPDITKAYQVIGEPTTTEGAAVLAKEDPFQFQAWALGLVGARVAGSDKKGGDKGIDGRLYFHDSTSGPTRQIIFSVKAGSVAPTFVDALWGVIEREKAEIGVLISFNEPTPGMKARAAEAGFYESAWGQHPRLQLLTIRELLDGKGINYPHVTGANVTHRRAARAKAPEPESLELFGEVAEDPEPYDSN